jgi:tRNA (guanine-N7-)-methyltransferase
MLGCMGLSSHGKTLDVGGVGVEQSALPVLGAGPVDLRGWFGEPGTPLYARPLELEIGSGKGTFLIRQAAALPEVNYVGLEYAKAYWRHAADRCRRHGLSNVRLVHAEAGVFVRNYVPDACLRQVHIYFPDPWPKKRHHKRRLIQEAFLRELHRVLEAKGVVRLATDHEDYFQWMRDQAAQVADLFEPLPFQSPEAAGEGELVGTNFERKYRREGRGFFGMVLRRI